MRTPLELYICRFMLGVCEAGFFPSVVYYFTVFFPEKYRTKILGMFIIVQPLSNAVGSPISGFILNIQHDWFGFAPRQLLFILEGLPPIVIGLLIPFLIKNSPKDVGYLNVEEKAWLMSNAGRSKSGSKITLGDFLKGIKNKKYLLYALLNFGMVCGIYGFGTGCRRSLPPFPAAISSALACWHSFLRHGRAAGVPVEPVGQQNQKAWRVRRPQHGGRRHRHLHRRTAVFIHARQHFHRCGRGRGLAVVSCIGNIGGFVAPYAVGVLNDLTGSSARAVFWPRACWPPG